MSEAKHTPGPWRVGKGGPNMCPTVGTEKGLMVAMVAYGDSHPTQANARLIAAAPDLLEALEELADLFDAMVSGEYRPDSFTTQPARAAIAKAKGDQR